MGQGKRSFGLGVIREHLEHHPGFNDCTECAGDEPRETPEASFCSFYGLTPLVLFTALLHLLQVSGGDWSIRTVPVKYQIAAA